ncbi:MAG: hypothetical protein HOE90_21930 [Bacteriovoracaceae bacterium]|nr:hypothetical protein [Bacteriovoracaceae bacterium]
MGKNIEILTYHDLYSKSLKGKKGYHQEIEFAKKYPKVLFNFMKEDSISFFVSFAPHISSLYTSSILHELQMDIVKEGFNFKSAGLPYTNYHLNKYSSDIKKYLFPGVFVLAFIFILILVRNLLAAYIIFCPPLFSALFSLALIKTFYIHMNMVTSIVPLVSFVISLAVVLHLYFPALLYGSARQAKSLKLMPTILMVVTTGIGFGSLVISPIKVIGQFAVLSCISIVFCSCASYLWMSRFLDYLILKAPAKKINLEILETLVKERPLRKRTTIILLPIFGLALFYILPKLPVVTDATRYFPVSSGIRKSIISVQKEVLGSPICEILLKKKNGESFSFEDFQILSSIEEKLSLAGKKTISPGRIIKDANYLYSSNLALPDFKISFLALKSKVQKDLQRFNPDDHIYRMTILGTAMNSSDYFVEIDKIKKLLSPYDYDLQLSGIYYNLMLAQDSLIIVLAQSFLLSLIIITILVSLYFRGIHYLFAFLIINIFPVMISLVMVYLTGMSINIATVMTYSISLGLVVDGTIHVIHTYPKLSFADFFETTVRPIFLGTIMLSICFFGFSIHGFLPIKQFGLILGSTILIGLFFDLFVLPSFLSSENS